MASSPPPPTSPGGTPLHSVGSRLIPMAARLKEAFAAAELSPPRLPEVVVLGSQSAGKSSVLEALVGRDFLPRGTGIVTRCPLVLTLVSAGNAPSAGPSSPGGSVDDDDAASSEPSTPAKKSASPQSSSPEDEQSDWQDYAEFLHQPGTLYTDFNKVREEIITRTAALAGGGKSIVDAPIRLKIYAQNVLDLTLVDLPGVTRVPVADQPQDIFLQATALIESYASSEHAILLPVTAANGDIANSDAIALARKFDPHGVRTLGVLTKCDLMDEGTDSSDVLSDKLGGGASLALGYIAVVNRGQAAVNSGMSLDYALAAESQFFDSVPAYAGRLRTRCGMLQLRERLSTLLAAKIGECLQPLKKRLTRLHVEARRDRAALGEPVHSLGRPATKRALLDALTRFARNLRDAVEGNEPAADILDTDSPSGVARIAHVLFDQFADSLLSLDPLDGLSDHDVRMAIANSNSLQCRAVLVPERAFQCLVKGQIARLEQPGLTCVQLVHDELLGIAHRCRPGEMLRHPALASRALDAVVSMLGRILEPTRGKVSDMIDFEMAFINTGHPDFLGSRAALAKLLERAYGGGQDAAAGDGAAASASLPPAPPAGAASPTSPGSDREVMYSRGGAAAPAAPETPPRTGGGLFGWFGGGDRDAQDDDSPEPEPLPRRGGRRASFGLSTKALDAYRESGIGADHAAAAPPAPAAEAAARGGSGGGNWLPCPPPGAIDVEVEIVKTLITSYFNIIRRDFADKVPKAIIACMVNHLVADLSNELVSELYDDSLVAELMREPGHIAEKRAAAAKLEGVLKRALSIISDVQCDVDNNEAPTSSPAEKLDRKVSGGGSRPASPRKVRSARKARRSMVVYNENSASGVNLMD